MRGDNKVLLSIVVVAIAASFGVYILMPEFEVNHNPSQNLWYNNYEEFESRHNEGELVSKDYFEIKSKDTIFVGTEMKFFNRAGMIVKRTFLDSAVHYVYNDNGMVKNITTNINNRITNTEFIYNNQDLLAKKNIYNSMGNCVGFQAFEYDSRGNIVTLENVSHGSTANFKHRIYYNELNKPVKKIFFHYDDTVNVELINYDEHGLLILENNENSRYSNTLVKNDLEYTSYFVDSVLLKFTISTKFENWKGLKSGGEKVDFQKIIISPEDQLNVYYANSLNIEVSSTLPNKNSNVQLCVPAAFTRIPDYGIDGLFCQNGVVSNSLKINHTLKAGLLVNYTFPKIMATNREVLNLKFVNSLKHANCFFFQQIALVINSKQVCYDKSSDFQRRALVELQNEKWAIVENIKNVTLSSFSHELVKMKVKNAIYLDMGSYDEGWVKVEDQIKVLGQTKTQTKNQSNWLIFIK